MLIQFAIQSKFLLSTSPTLVKAGRSVGPDQQPDRRARAAYTGSLLDLSCQDPHHHVQEVEEHPHHNVLPVPVDEAAIAANEAIENNQGEEMVLFFSWFDFAFRFLQFCRSTSGLHGGRSTDMSGSGLLRLWDPGA
mgnify:CR=1 FL=1